MKTEQIIKENKVRCSINIRLPKEEKRYYEHQLKVFCEKFSNKKPLSIQFGKQSGKKALYRPGGGRDQKRSQNCSRR